MFAWGDLLAGIRRGGGRRSKDVGEGMLDAIAAVKCQLSCPVGDNYLSSRGIGSVPWLSDNYGERPRVDHQKRDAPRSGREHVFPARPVVWVRSLPG